MLMQIAISIATADQDFAKQIAEMLEQIAYIDDCDTLGQKAERKVIHKVIKTEFLPNLSNIGIGTRVGVPKDSGILQSSIRDLNQKRSKADAQNGFGDRSSSQHCERLP